MSGQSLNEVSSERLLRGRKHLLQSVIVSVAVSKPAETDLAFVQRDAKINCVNYDLKNSPVFSPPCTKGDFLKN